MIFISAYRLAFISMVFISLNVSCKSQIDYTLNADIVKYTKNSFDIQQKIGKEYKAVSTKIRNGKALIMAIDSGRKSYFVIADLNGKRIDYSGNNIIDKYYSTIWDASGNTLVSASAQIPYDLALVDIRTSKVDRKSFHKGDWLSSTDIIIKNNQVFYLAGVRGVALLNLKTNNVRVFKNPEILVSNYSSCTLAYPLDSSLNLLSGHTIANNIIKIYAINNQDSTKWEYSVKQNQNGESISLLNYPYSFIAKYDSVIIALNKNTGKEVWRNTMQNSIREIYKWQDKILAYCLVNPKGTHPDNDDFEYKVVFKLFDSNNGKELWSKDITSINIPHLGICNDRLLVSDNKTFAVFLLNDGSVIEKKVFSKKDKNNYTFEMLTDMKTGDYYLKSYDGKFYW